MFKINLYNKEVIHQQFKMEESAVLLKRPQKNELVVPTGTKSRKVSFNVEKNETIK